MTTQWLSEKKVEQTIQQLGAPMTLAEHHWLSYFYRYAVFHPDYHAREDFGGAVILTQTGKQLRDACAAALELPIPDVSLALYGYFYHHDILVDFAATDVNAMSSLLRDDLLQDRIRLPFV